MAIEDEWKEFFRARGRGVLKRIEPVIGIHNLVDLIEGGLSDEGCLVIPLEQQILPSKTDGAREMPLLRFKKGYRTISLGYHTKEECLEKRLEPQQLMKEAVERAYARPIEVYLAGNDFITRRGFSYPTRTGRINRIIPQTEIVKGWQLFAALLNFGIQPKHYSRGDFFEAHIPSRDNLKQSDRVELFRLPTDPIKRYAQWPNLQKASTAELALYETESHDYEIKPIRFNFKDIATYLLRGITTQVETREGVKTIEPLLLNPFPAPQPEKVEFSRRLANSVYREVLKTGKSGEIRVIRPLNEAEIEVFDSMWLYKHRFDGSYVHDEGFRGAVEYAKYVFEKSKRV